jgi:PadR family transcriptional regulator PadR
MYIVMNDTEKTYADQLAVQMRKGLLAYCVLTICSRAEGSSSSDIIEQLGESSLLVVEGTMYPLLNRLQKDGLLTHSWKESSQGPPRKLYHMSPMGKAVLAELRVNSQQLQQAIQSIEGNK